MGVQFEFRKANNSSNLDLKLRTHFLFKSYHAILTTGYCKGEFWTQDLLTSRRHKSENQSNQPVNWGATVPSVNFENLRDAKIIGLCCSRSGSTLLLINSEAAYFNRSFVLITTSNSKINHHWRGQFQRIYLINIWPYHCEMRIQPI